MGIADLAMPILFLAEMFSILMLGKSVCLKLVQYAVRVVRMTEKDARDAKQMRMLLEAEAKSKMEIF